MPRKWTSPDIWAASMVLLVLSISSALAEEVSCSLPVTTSTEVAGCGCNSNIFAYKYNGDGTRDVVYWGLSGVPENTIIKTASTAMVDMSPNGTSSCGYPGYWLGYDPAIPSNNFNYINQSDYIYSQDGKRAGKVGFTGYGHTTCLGAKSDSGIGIRWTDNTNFQIYQHYLAHGDFGSCIARCDSGANWYEYQYINVSINASLICTDYLPDSYKTGLVDAVDNPVTVPDSLNGYLVKVCKVEHQQCICDLKVSSLIGTSTTFRPYSGESVGIQGTISDLSAKPISWILSIFDQTFTGTGATASKSWDGKDAMGKLVPPGVHTATLTATNTVACSDTKILMITALPALPVISCPLNVKTN